MHWTEDEYQWYLQQQHKLYLQRQQTRLRQQQDKAALPGAAAPGSLSETEFLTRIRRLAKEAGFLVYHTHDSRRSDEGFPDIVATDGARVLWIELKSATGKLTAAQARWIELLQHAGQECYIWRPKDWPAIIEILTHRKVS